MIVEQLMTRNAQTCSAADTLNKAAQIMWEADCGCVPVVDSADHLVGILTDRDVCMAAYTQGGRLSELHVSQAMSRNVFTCKPGDSVAAAETCLRTHQVRRLPVVDEEGHVMGVLSLNDIACEAQREREGKGKRHITADEIAATLGAVSSHRGSGELAASAMS